MDLVELLEVLPDLMMVEGLGVLLLDEVLEIRDEGTDEDEAD